MKVQLLEQAAAEFEDDIARYESVESGLGARLKTEIKSSVAWIFGQLICPGFVPRATVGSI